ncbi:neutral zinc metallopeptidase [Nonomuraea sp. NPDC050022]|uniref:neutral zinc metallopeptidase n=1 Tax=Nonomuraea sp. NPDC050022 TaxID=3364358 RepID=UPI0037981296
MRKFPIMALTVASMLSLTGTATAATTAADPVKHPKLIANPLYEAGALPVTTCDEPSVKRNNRKLARAYIDAIVACLDTTWEQHLTAAGLPFSKPKVRHVDKFPKTYCGMKTRKDDSQVYYCDRTNTLTFQVGKSWLEDPSDMWLLNTVSYVYGWHVKKLVGIADAYDVLSVHSKAEDRELSRRSSLQNECFSGAFIKSVWPLKGRTTKDWTYLQSMQNGDSAGEARWYGKTATIVAWSKRGFATGDPGSCNTWAAPSSKVA